MSDPIPKRITKAKKVYFAGRWWKVVYIHRPNDYECYFLVQRNSGSVHWDLDEEKDIPAMDVQFINVFDDEFLLDTPKNRKFVKGLKLKEDKIKDLRDSMRITDLWLESLEG